VSEPGGDVTARQPETANGIEVNTIDNLLLIRMNRPKQRNAMTLAGSRDIAAALDRLDEDPQLAAAVITGANHTFCSGMDLERFRAGETASLPGRGFGGFTGRPARKPLIAAVEGYALGGGFEMVLASDLAVAAEDAVFGLPEVRRGLVARAGGVMRLPRRVPAAIAAEMILIGEPISAARAAELGLVNRVVPAERVLEVALALASRVAENAPLALMAAKTIMQQSHTWAEDEWFGRQSAITDPIFASEDAREGALAMLERRPARWQGR
jgi:enoyl-CoA hydratase